jgi:F-type H+-transporting ATPase subunit b
MSALDSLGINPGLVLVQIISFIVVYTLVTRFAYDPIAKVLRERRERIARGLEDADAAAKARSNAEKEAESILQKARADAQKVVEEARGRGEELAKAIEAEARADAEKTRSDAQAGIVEARNVELAGVRGQVAAIAVAVAQQLIGEALDAKRQQALIADFFAKVPAEAKSLSGSVEVVSAMPLSDSEQAKVKKETGADDVTFSVDPAILGGLVIRAGDRVVDGSVRSNLGELAGRL